MTFAKLVQHLVVVIGLCVAAAAPAADKKKAAAPMDEKAAMEAMAKAATPGEAHKKLDPLVGTFDAKARQWMDPSKPPAESTGTIERKWILDNRYVQEQYTGSFGGQPFTGMGYQGYDNVTKKYVATWIDSMGTGMTLSSGKMVGNVLKTTGDMSDPATGKTSKYTMVTTIADNDHHNLEMWAPGPGGKNVKWMEISFTRKK
ncbi:MAG: DUF1579 domain-containing protein [Pseudomonadota bacterium]